MAFTSARRSTLGQGQSSGQRGVSQPRGSFNNAGGQAAASGQRGGDGKPRSVWTTAATFYDDYHSAMEIQVVSEFYNTKFGLKLAPVYGERRGPNDGGTGKKYNYDDAVMVVLDLGECIIFREMLASFIAGQLTEGTVARENKRIVLARAESYYDESHPEYAEHAGGLVVSIEQDATEKQDAKAVVFVSRPQYVLIQDGQDEGMFYPEMQALQAVLESYVSNCARVDFGSVRLLEGGRSGAEDRPAGPSAPQPMRRSGGLAPANANAPAASTAPAPAAGTMRAAAGTRQPAISQDVSDADIGAALGDNAAALDAALGDAPKF